MEQALKKAKIKVPKAYQKLLMLITGRIIARGYAMVKEGDPGSRFGCEVTEGTRCHSSWEMAS